MNDVLVIYKDKAGEWRWRIRTRGYKIVADSGEGYKTKHSCKYAARRLFRKFRAKEVWLQVLDSPKARSYWESVGKECNPELLLGPLDP